MSNFRRERYYALFGSSFTHSSQILVCSAVPKVLSFDFFLEEGEEWMLEEAPGKG